MHACKTIHNYNEYGIKQTLEVKIFEAKKD